MANLKHIFLHQTTQRFNRNAPLSTTISFLAASDYTLPLVISFAPLFIIIIQFVFFLSPAITTHADYS